MNEKTIPNTHKRILASIPVGADSRSVTGKELAATHRMDCRTIQAIIRRLIVEYGVPICASRDINGATLSLLMIRNAWRVSERLKAN